MCSAGGNVQGKCASGSNSQENVDGIDAVLVIRLAISRAIKPLLAGAQALALWRYGWPTPGSMEAQRIVVAVDNGEREKETLSPVIEIPSPPALRLSRVVLQAEIQDPPSICSSPHLGPTPSIFAAQQPRRSECPRAHTPRLDSCIRCTGVRLLRNRKCQAAHPERPVERL